MLLKGRLEHFAIFFRLSAIFFHLKIPLFSWIT